MSRDARFERAVAPCLAACTPVLGSRLRGGSGKLSPATLAVLAGAPLAAVGTDGGAATVLAPAPLAVMLADARAPAVLALAPAAVMLADARAPAVLAFAPLAVMLANARTPAVLALPLSPVMLALLFRPRRGACPAPHLLFRHGRLLPRLPLPLLRGAFPDLRPPARAALAPLLPVRTPALAPASAPWRLTLTKRTFALQAQGHGHTSVTSLCLHKLHNFPAFTCIHCRWGGALRRAVEGGGGSQV